MAKTHQRVAIETDPNVDTSRYGFMGTSWPAKWVGPQTSDPRQSYVFVFRRVFELPAAEGKKSRDGHRTLRIHLSADQRYELTVDGQYVGRGVERSELKNWVYESYDLVLAPGKHEVAVRLYWLSPEAPAPEAQQTHTPAIMVYGEGEANELLSTGVASWQYQHLAAYTFHDHDRLNAYFATGAQLHIDGRQIRPEVERGEDSDGWLEVRGIADVALAAQRWESTPYWILRPAFLPPMYEKVLHLGRTRHVEQAPEGDIMAATITGAANLATEQPSWNRLLGKGGSESPLVIAPHTTRRVLFDLEDYYCAFPQLTCSGDGATIRIGFAEGLYYKSATRLNYAVGSKGNRDEIEGKCFLGVGFEVIASGQTLTYQPHQFMAGRYVEVVIRTADEPLRISGLSFLETHYPFRFTGRFASSDPNHKQIIPVALRTVEMCSHDTSMDCPYYERLNYVGDTRLQSLIAYVAADDDRLARKCITLFDLSRQPSTTGFTYSRYPTRTIQTIPTFSLWWTCMVHDFAMWRNDPEFVLQRMPGVRGVVEAWRSCLDTKSGLLRSPAGWNFVDWVPAWGSGIPAGGAGGSFSSIINMQAIYAFGLLADLEDYLGETLLARRHRALAAKLRIATHKGFFDAKTGLYADDLAHAHYSEHAQCLAVLSGMVSPVAGRKLMQKMMQTRDLCQCTIYFSHYLFEALGKVGMIDPVLQRLETWKELRTHGFRTTFESPEPSRSDCHAWGAHPVYHFLATIAGIRPAGFGFASAEIRPQLGTLTHIEGSLPHTSGMITFDLHNKSGKLSGHITLPESLPAVLHANGTSRKLKAGKNVIR